MERVTTPLSSLVSGQRPVLLDATFPRWVVGATVPTISGLWWL